MLAFGDLWISGGQTSHESGFVEFMIGYSGYEENVTVEYRTVSGSATEGSDFEAASGTLTFSPGCSPINVTVAILDDLFCEEDESFSMELFNATNASIDLGWADATILPSDHAPVIEEIGDQEVDEGNEFYLSVYAYDIDEPAETLTYSLEPGAPAGVTIDPEYGYITWQTEEADGPASYNITVRVTDSASLYSTRSFNVTVNEVNMEPTASWLDDVYVDEDSADTVISLWGAFDDAEDTASGLSYSIVDNSDPSLFSAVSIDPGTGQLTLSYAPNAHGSSYLTIRAVDSGGLSVELGFTVNVEQISDAPIMTAFSMVHVNGDVWAISGSVSDIDDHPWDMSIQFGGILAGYQIDAWLDESGYFFTEVELPELETGLATGWAVDGWGLESNVQTVLVTV